jgi:hypothetical protein
VIDGTGLALIGGAIALYAYDASLMLFRDEVVFAHGRRGWRAVLGSGFLLGGRYLVMPGAWMPGMPMFRACWSQAPHRAGPRAPMRVLLRALRPLQWASRVLAVLLFVAMPVGLFLHAAPTWMLALVAAMYGIALACVGWAWRCRRVFGLDGKGLASLAFEVIACPPFAVNVVMKLTLRLGLPQSPQEFARRVLAPAECTALLRTAHARMHPDALHEEPLP